MTGEDPKMAVAMPQALVCAYRLPGDVRIEEALQREGPPLWAVRRLGNCLNKDGEFEYEPSPSSRDDNFYSRCRWPTPQAAYSAWQSAQNT